MASAPAPTADRPSNAKRCAGCRLFPLLCSAVVAHALYYWPQLPQSMAVHFDGAGVPNGWSSRGGFYTLHFALLLFIAGLFGSARLWLRRLPARWINMPRRTYRLAPERRAASLGELSARLVWFGNAVLALDLFAVHLVYRYKLGLDAPFDSRTLVLGLVGYGLVVIIWLLALRRRLPRPSSLGEGG